jgi:phosphoserine phosphatase
MIKKPVVIDIRIVLRLLEGIASEMEEQWHSQFCERLTPDAERLTAILKENDFPVVVTGGDNLAVVIHVPELVGVASPSPFR